MTHRRIHLLEKIQVQLATAGSLAVVYFALWPGVRPWDPEGPVTFLPGGNYVQLLSFVVACWALAAACAIATIHARPEGALLAVLLGAGGISLHSPRIRGLLWWRMDDVSGMYWEMIVEVLILTVVLFAIAITIVLIRRAIRRLRPGWVWKHPLARLSESQQELFHRAGAGRSKRLKALEASVMDWMGAGIFRLHLGVKDRHHKEQPAGYNTFYRCLNFMLLALIVAIVLLMLLMRSADRGQILFALLGGSAIAVVVAHQVFPAPYSIVAAAVPVLVAVLFYALAALTSIDGSAQAWIDVPLYARALPVDWLTAGAGGAVLGYWISARIHESRLMEQLEEEQSKQGA